MRPGRAADHSPPSSAAVMEEESYTSTNPLDHTGPVKGKLYHMCVCVCVCVSVCVCVACHINRLDFLMIFFGCYTSDQLGDCVLRVLVGRVLKDHGTVGYPLMSTSTIASPHIPVTYKLTAPCSTF